MKTADYSTVEDLQRRMVEQCNVLDDLVEHVAKARQILNYESDRKKNALAAAVSFEVGQDKTLSVSMAEHRARCNRRPRCGR